METLVEFEESIELSREEAELADLLTRLHVEMVEEEVSAERIELIDDHVGMDRTRASVREVIGKTVSVVDMTEEELDQLEAILSSDLGAKLVELISDAAVETTTVFQFAVEQSRARDIQEGGFGGQLPT